MQNISTIELLNRTDLSQYLTFTLGPEHYALEVGRVREVLEYTSVTRIPKAPPFLRGVINLRGQAVPVVDLKLLFGLGATEKGIDTCIIVAEVTIGETLVVLGLLGDSVQEVVDLDPREIEPAPDLGTRTDNRFIAGMGKLEDRFLIILDIDRVLSEDELAAVEESQTSG